jgi:hypothetical protein
MKRIFHINHSIYQGSPILCLSLAFLVLPALSFTQESVLQEKRFEQYFTGRLGQYPIELLLKRDGNQLAGNYIQRFRHEQRKISLEGEINDEGKFKVKGKGIFTGKLSDGKLSGHWYRSEDSREKYPFRLEVKNPDYYDEDYWKSAFLGENGIKIPINTEINEIDKEQFLNDQTVLCQDLLKKTDLLETTYSISFPLEDSSIVTKFYLEVGLYQHTDSLREFLPSDSVIRYHLSSSVLDGVHFQSLSHSEGDTGGSNNSRLYFYKETSNDRAWLFHLFYSYSNPWTYGNPYSEEEYDGPFINDLNRLVEIAETILGSL